MRRVQTRERDEEIARLYRRESAPPDVIASLFGISRRTVFRVLARQCHLTVANHTAGRIE
jgi:DNA invertase Pin-like site-specific DNA recombinase